MAKQKGLSFQRKRKNISMSLIREIGAWFIEICITIFVAFVCIFFFGMRTSIIGVSMEPGLYNGQEILINRLVYQVFNPKRFDVIVFLPGGTQASHLYCKRVVGLPNDKIQIKDGRVYINDEALEEQGNYDKMAVAGIAETEITLENGEFFVLGDNRNNSEDSRSASIGIVKRDTIIGKAWFHMAAGGAGMGLVK